MNTTARMILNECGPRLIAVAHNLQKEEITLEDTRQMRMELNDVRMFINSAEILMALPEPE